MRKNVLVLDFDGTLTTHDSPFAFQTYDEIAFHKDSDERRKLAENMDHYCSKLNFSAEDSLAWTKETLRIYADAGNRRDILTECTEALIPNNKND